MSKQESASRMERNNIFYLHTAMKQQLTLDSLIIVKLRICNFPTRVWIGVAPHLSVNMVLGKSFTDEFVRKLVPSEEKLVPWHSHPAAILACRRSFVVAAVNLVSPALSKKNCAQSRSIEVHNGLYHGRAKNRRLSKRCSTGA